MTGASGHFGRTFCDVAAGQEIVPAFHRQRGEKPETARRFELLEPESCRRLVHDTRPDVVVHAAAWTNVDACEADPVGAMQANEGATSEIARAAQEIGARLCYISTDYVFDGTKGDYSEDDTAHPIQTYGQSKLAGEAHVRAVDGLVVRTSTVFSDHKPSFMSWLAGELAAGRPVRVAEDQRTNPTWAHDCATQVLHLVRKGARGVYHAAGATALTRYECAVQVAAAGNHRPDLVVGVPMARLPWIAPRPRDTSLHLEKVARLAAPMPFPMALAAWLRRRNATMPSASG